MSPPSSPASASPGPRSRPARQEPGVRPPPPARPLRPLLRLPRHPDARAVDPLGLPGLLPPDRPRPGPDRTPVERLALERLQDGGFKQPGPACDALTIAIVETGVALRAFDADALEGGSASATRRRARGWPGTAGELPQGTLVVADDRGPVGGAVRARGGGAGGREADPPGGGGRDPGRTGCRRSRLRRRYGWPPPDAWSRLGRVLIYSSSAMRELLESETGRGRGRRRARGARRSCGARSAGSSASSGALVADGFGRVAMPHAVAAAATGAAPARARRARATCATSSPTASARRAPRSPRGPRSRPRNRELLDGAARRAGGATGAGDRPRRRRRARLRRLALGAALRPGRDADGLVAGQGLLRMSVSRAAGGR